MGKPLRIELSLNTLQNGERLATVTTTTTTTIARANTYGLRTTNDDVDEFDGNTHAFIPRRTLSRMPLLVETNAYRVVCQHPEQQQQQKTQEKGYDELVRKPSNSNENLRLEVPGYRKVDDLEPLRAMPRHNVEVCTDEVYLKRHEKYEKQEKLIKRRDRKRQREEMYRLHLMKVEKSSVDSPPKIESIEVVEKRPRRKKDPDRTSQTFLDQSGIEPPSSPPLGSHNSGVLTTTQPAVQLYNKISNSAAFFRTMPPQTARKSEAETPVGQTPQVQDIPLHNMTYPMGTAAHLETEAIRKVPDRKCHKKTERDRMHAEKKFEKKKNNGTERFQKKLKKKKGKENVEKKVLFFNAFIIPAVVAQHLSFIN